MVYEINSESSFMCHTYCNTVPPVLRSSERLVILTSECRALGKRAITTQMYFNVLGLFVCLSFSAISITWWRSVFPNTLYNVSGFFLKFDVAGKKRGTSSRPFARALPLGYRYSSAFRSENHGSFGYNLKNGGTVSQQWWQVKEPSLLKTTGAWSMER
jgi:hypothetical protein